EFRTAEVRLAEARALELRTGEVRLAEVRPAEVRPAEVRLFEVRTDIGVRATPCVPGGHALLEHCDVLVGRHGSTRLDSAPLFPGLAFHRWRFRVLELQPVLRPTRTIARPEPFRDDAFKPHLASVPKYALAIVGEVLVQAQPRKA